MREQFKKFYLEWANNYLSVALIAEHNNITEDEAVHVIAWGRKYHEEDVNKPHTETF